MYYNTKSATKTIFPEKFLFFIKKIIRNMSSSLNKLQKYNIVSVYCFRILFHFYISLLATMSTPKPRIFGTITSPAFTGAWTTTFRRYSTHSAIFPFGNTSAETTGNRGKKPPTIRTVVVSIRRGSVTSVSAYFAPRGQVLPVTLMNFPFSIVTVISHPMGHMIQFITFVFIFSVSFLITPKHINSVTT